ncbi:hypothetical protein KCP74_19760 [Salmonella enterica subsp. enterica]|nr:hypothetical protein KCP74_19760 [Salmonella enterica subsp. enterica]
MIFPVHGLFTALRTSSRVPDAGTADPDSLQLPYRGLTQFGVDIGFSRCPAKWLFDIRVAGLPEALCNTSGKRKSPAHAPTFVPVLVQRCTRHAGCHGDRQRASQPVRATNSAA